MKLKYPILLIAITLLLQHVKAQDANLLTDTNSAYSCVDEHTQTKVYFIVDKMPEYSHGNKALTDELMCRLGNTEHYENGKVSVQFIVEPNGTSRNAKIVSSNNANLNETTITIFNNLNHWIAGQQNGEKVKVALTVQSIFKNGTLKFKLNNKVLK